MAARLGNGGLWLGPSDGDGSLHNKVGGAPMVLATEGFIGSHAHWQHDRVEELRNGSLPSRIGEEKGRCHDDSRPW